jgi:hypothetical protein
MIEHPRARRLLVVSCSSRKHRVTNPSKAWDLYDGVAYRLMKKAQREGQFARDIDILILSAKHGLISPSRCIRWYDQQMDSARSSELVRQVTSRLKKALSATQYSEVLLWVGKDYLTSLTPLNAWEQPGLIIHIAHGRIGERLRQLKKWIAR